MGKKMLPEAWRMAIPDHGASARTPLYSKTATAKKIISGRNFDNSSDPVVKNASKPNKTKAIFDIGGP